MSIMKQALMHAAEQIEDHAEMAMDEGDGDPFSMVLGAAIMRAVGRGGIGMTISAEVIEDATLYVRKWMLQFEDDEDWDDEDEA